MAVAQKVAESLSAKYIRIALAIFRKLDDSLGYDAVAVNTAPVSLNSRAGHFECNAHDPHGFAVKLWVAKKWCDWHDAYPHVPHNPGLSFYGDTGETAVMPITLWSYRRKL